MKRIIIFLILAVSMTCYSQIRIKLNGSAAIPLGYSSKYVDAGTGGILNVSYLIDNWNLEISASGGYHYFGVKETLPDYEFSYTSIPVMLGLRYNVTEGSIYPYVGIDVVYYFNDYKLSVDYTSVQNDVVYRTKENTFGFSPEVGFKININPSFSIDANLKYNRIKTVYVSREHLLVQTGFCFNL